MMAFLVMIHKSGGPGSSGDGSGGAGRILSRRRVAQRGRATGRGGGERVGALKIREPELGGAERAVRGAPDWGGVEAAGGGLRLPCGFVTLVHACAFSLFVLRSGRRELLGSGTRRVRLVRKEGSGGARALVDVVRGVRGHLQGGGCTLQNLPLL